MTWDGQASAEAQTDHRHVNFSAQGGSRARVRPEEHRDDGLREVPPAIIDDVANHKSQTPSGFSAQLAGLVGGGAMVRTKMSTGCGAAPVASFGIALRMYRYYTLFTWWNFVPLCLR